MTSITKTILQEPEDNTCGFYILKVHSPDPTLNIVNMTIYDWKCQVKADPIPVDIIMHNQPNGLSIVQHKNHQELISGKYCSDYPFFYQNIIF